MRERQATYEVRVGIQQLGEAADPLRPSGVADDALQLLRIQLSQKGSCTAKAFKVE
jgi:hypothetical protein